MNLKPLYDRLVLRPIEEDRTTVGGIVIPDSASAEKPMQGEVLAVGAGRLLDSGEHRSIAVKVGDRVIYGKFAGTEVKLSGDDNKVVIMREDDIMAIVE